MKRIMRKAAIFTLALLVVLSMPFNALASDIEYLSDEVILPALGYRAEDEAPEASATPEVSEAPEVVPTLEASEDFLTPEDSETPEEYISPYAIVKKGATLYADEGRRERLGTVAEDSIMLATELVRNENGSLYELYFDTDESKEESLCEHAYFYASKLERPDQAETEKYIASKSSYHSVDGMKVFVADVEYVQPEETEEPTEGSTETYEPTPRKVSVAMHCDTETLQLGSTITLIADLEGYEGEEYVLRWQWARVDQSGSIVGEWQDTTEDTPSICYILTEENITTAWRVCVTVIERDTLG